MRDDLNKLGELLKDTRGDLPKTPHAVPPVHVGGNASNINIGGNQWNINTPAPEMLSLDQRKRLNQLVKDIETEYKADPRILWRTVVHTRTGVSTIDDIPESKFELAEQALLDHARLLHAQRHAKKLEADLQKLTAQSGPLADELRRFCDREFGRHDLSKLSPEELKAALDHVEQRAAAPSRPETQAFSSQLYALVCNSPLHLGAFLLAGIVIGKIF